MTTDTCRIVYWHVCVNNGAIVPQEIIMKKTKKSPVRPSVVSRGANAESGNGASPGSARKNVDNIDLIIGKRYAIGDGVKTDIRQAFGYLRRAAMNGSDEAVCLAWDMHTISQAMKTGSFTCLDELCRAPESAPASVAYGKSTVYRLGCGIQMNIELAMRNLSLAFMRRHKNALFHLRYLL